MRTVTYVKTGLPGYGPDLDENDIGHDPADIRAICDDIRQELDILGDMLNDHAEVAAEAGDYETAWKTHKRGQELETLSMTLDHGRRQHAPLYRDDPAALDDALQRTVDKMFPLDVSDQVRLYVWDAETDQDD